MRELSVIEEPLGSERILRPLGYWDPRRVARPATG